MHKHRKQKITSGVFGGPAPKPPFLIQGTPPPIFQAPRAAVRKCHKLVASNNRNVFSHPPGGPPPRQGVGHVLSDSLGFFLAFPTLPAIRGLLWFVDESLRSPPLLSHCVLPVSEPRCPNSPFVITTPAISDLGPARTQCDLIVIFFFN